MIRQTVVPLKWIIVDDGSTDQSPEIVCRYLGSYPWIELVTMPPRQDWSFAAKPHAVKAGCERVAGLAYEILGNLGVDISFDCDHFEFLLRQFAQDLTSAWQELSSRRKAIVRKRTASKGIGTLQVNANCFEDSAGRKSAVTCRIALGSRLDRRDDSPHDGLGDTVVRNEQMAKLKAILDSLLTFKMVDGFRVLPEKQG